MRHVLRAVFLCVLLPCSSIAAVYTVTNTNDSGIGSFRDAILVANANPGIDSIHFSIGTGGQKTIQPLTPLPLIADAVAIDATTQPGWTGNPIIELDGSLVTAATTVEKNGLTVCAVAYIRGLVINRFAGSGIGIAAYSSAPGVVPDGTAVLGCWIGVGVDGTTPLINGRDGIVVGANDCLIGGDGANEGNLISFNGRNGIIIGQHWAGYTESNTGHRTRVEGNFIGTDVTGMTALGNSLSGIAIHTGSDTVIGGSTAAQGNLISGNGGRGVAISDTWLEQGVHVLRNTIARNRIGVNAAGGALGNGYFAGSFEGVYVSAPEVTVFSNTIANNSAAGVAVYGSRVTISQNSIDSNGALGVDLLNTSGFPGVTPNDSGDGDAGPNTLLNFATLTEAINEIGNTKVTGSYSGAASQAFTVELYGNVSCDGSGYGEGKVYLAAAGFSTNASGAGSFVVAVSPQQSVGSAMTALVRDANGNTSEFSPCRSVVATPPPSITNISPNGGPYGATVTITGSGFTPVNGVFFSDGGFGAGISASFTVNSSSSITTTVPTGTQTGPIRVESPYGVALSSTFTPTNPSPTIASITPNSGPAAGGTPVTITGTGFLSGASVLIGAAYATDIVVVSPTTITAVTAQQYAGEPVAINVFNPDGKGAWKYNAFTFYCSPDLSATITAPATVRPRSTGNTASVPDGGIGVTYAWGVTGGTITSGAGTRTITFTAGTTGDVSIQVRVDRADCSAYSMRVIPLVDAVDFSGDGKSDLLWRQPSSGKNVLWVMDGALRLTYMNLLDVAGTDWSIGGTGDFSGDGKPDILWRNAATGQNVVWIMNGPIRQSYLTILSVPAPWEVGGVGDFDADGDADIVWRNGSLGQNVLWTMSGTTRQSLTNLPKVIGAEWRIGGAGDLTGDGKADLVWRNYTTGQNVLWTMNGATRTAQANLLAIPDPAWRLSAIANYSGDGKADLVWRNVTSGQNALWTMNGATRLSITSLISVPDASWTIAGPR